MPQRELLTTKARCPECNALLTPDGDVLLCADHGAFFSYGPQLLVRAVPAQSQKLHLSRLPDAASADNGR